MPSQAERLPVAHDLPDAPVLVEELTAFRQYVSEDGRDSYGLWRDRAHDDLLFSLAVSVWWGEKTGGPHLAFVGPVVGL